MRLSAVVVFHEFRFLSISISHEAQSRHTKQTHVKHLNDLMHTGWTDKNFGADGVAQIATFMIQF